MIEVQVDITVPVNAAPAQRNTSVSLERGRNISPLPVFGTHAALVFIFGSWSEG